MLRRDTPDTRNARLRIAAIVAVSVGAHAGLLGYVASRTFELKPWTRGIMSDPFSTGGAIPVWLEPRPLLRGETSRVRRTAPARSPVEGRRPGDRAPGTPGRFDSIDAGSLDDDGSRDDRSSPPPVAASPAGPWTAPTPDLGARIARGLRTRGPGCASPGWLTAAEQRACDAAFGERAGRALPISSTGDAARDARFARQGSRRLASYEAIRAPLSPSDDPPCDGGGPVGECEIEIKIELFSTTRGWLPNLRNPDE